MQVMINRFQAAVNYLRRHRLNREAQNLISANRAFWSRYDKSVTQTPDSYVLVEPNAQPVIRHCNASFAAIVSYAKDLRPLYILSSVDAATRDLLLSYTPNAKFVSLQTPRYFILLLMAVLRAALACLRLRRPADILNLTVDGIRFGDMVYDNILTGGYATVSRIDRRALRSLVAFYWYRGIIRDILRRYRIQTSIFSHTIGISSGTFARYLLRSGVEIITRLGSHQIILKKTRRLEDLGVFPTKPEPAYFAWMLKNYEQHIEIPASDYLKARLNQEVNHLAVNLAFNRKNRLYKSSDEFCREMGLAPSRPTVFVMLHAFNDFPHSHFTKPMLFQDYYVWFRRTLEIATKVTTVNWVFKEHPAAALYVTHDLNLDDLFGGMSKAHIRFLSRDADFNAASVAVIASAVVTCQGTVGLEYSSMGKPCLLAGESPYSGLGFSNEPPTVADYERQLCQIASLPRLTDDQIRGARTALYFQLCMLQNSQFLFCPFYGHDEIVAMTNQRFWAAAASHLNNTESSALEHQVDSLAEFVRQKSNTQYVDVGKYDFMRPVIYGIGD